MTASQFNWQSPDKHDPVLSYCHDTPAGQLILRMRGNILCNIEWLTEASSEQMFRALTTERQQLFNDAWLSSTTDITLALLRQGTPFQHTVWGVLCSIPFGQTKTYGELASQLNTSPRALANACRNNPFPLLIPCHRVVAKMGIGGYAGQLTGKLIEIKKHYYTMKK